MPRPLKNPSYPPVTFSEELADLKISRSTDMVRLAERPLFSSTATRESVACAGGSRLKKSLASRAIGGNSAFMVDAALRLLGWARTCGVDPRGLFPRAYPSAPNFVVIVARD